MEEKNKEMQLKEKEAEQVSGGANENGIEINVKTLSGDNDDYHVKSNDKINDLISKYNSDKQSK